MNGRNWVTNLLELTGFVFFAFAIVGLVVFIWGSVAPGQYEALTLHIGYRPTGLVLLVGGYCGGLAFMACAEMIRFLRAIAGRG